METVIKGSEARDLLGELLMEGRVYETVACFLHDGKINSSCIGMRFLSRQEGRFEFNVFSPGDTFSHLGEAHGIGANLVPANRVHEMLLPSLSGWNSPDIEEIPRSRFRDSAIASKTFLRVCPAFVTLKIEKRTEATRDDDLGTARVATLLATLEGLEVDDSMNLEGSPRPYPFFSRVDGFLAEMMITGTRLRSALVEVSRLAGTPGEARAEEFAARQRKQLIHLRSMVTKVGCDADNSLAGKIIEMASGTTQGKTRDCDRL
jgi:hypothetical protein